MEDRNKTITAYSENRLINKSLVKDNELIYLIKKTEKIATAVYMITNFFDSDEPLKWELRKTTTKLLKDIMSFNHTSLSFRETVITRNQNNFMELGTLFNLAYNSGFISQMNFSIVIEEINKLSSLIGRYHLGQISAQKTLFNEDYFTVKNTAEKSLVSIKDIIKDKSISNQKDIKDQKTVVPKLTFNGKKRDLNEFFSKLNKKEKDKTEVKTERFDKILKLIKDNGPVTIKDISAHFSNLSEKTIQRDLQKMLDQNQIRKEGERRWTKYFI